MLVLSYTGHLFEKIHTGTFRGGDWCSSLGAATERGSRDMGGGTGEKSQLVENGSKEELGTDRQATLCAATQSCWDGWSQIEKHSLAKRKWAGEELHISSASSCSIFSSQFAFYVISYVCSFSIRSYGSGGSWVLNQLVFGEMNTDLHVAKCRIETGKIPK